MENEEINKIVVRNLMENANLESIRLVNKLLDKSNTPKKLSEIIEDIKNLSKEHNKENKSKYGAWKVISGNYLIYLRGTDKKNIVYVGETEDLVRRIKGDIAGSEIKNKNNNERITHTFIRKLKNGKTIPSFKITNDKELQEILEKEFFFSYIETPSKILAQIVERIILELYFLQLWNKEADKLKNKRLP